MDDPMVRRQPLRGFPLLDGDEDAGVMGAPVRLGGDEPRVLVERVVEPPVVERRSARGVVLQRAAAVADGVTRLRRLQRLRRLHTLATRLRRLPYRVQIEVAGLR